MCRMTRQFKSTLALTMLLAAITAAQATGSRLVSIETPRGVKQAFILIAPDKPVASVILFAGGSGGLGLKSASSMKWGAGNFLVRTRDMFAADGFAVAVVDAPSDHRKGMNAIFRMSAAHASDIAAVAAYLNKQANVPVWLVGTSMGTFSAAEGAIAASGVDGLVLTSTITRSEPHWNIAKSHPDGVASMALARITVPTLIVSHRKDSCDLSPAAGASKLKRRLTNAGRVEIALLDGGDPPRSKPCEAKAQHGYFGIEAKAVGTIAKFIKANTK
jgi:pimeloyl-ACP methyl ester carboxylesterase